MSAKSGSENPSSRKGDIPVIRFLQGAKLLGQTRLVKGDTLVEHGESAGVKIPTNCTSGTCGTCMVTLIDGEVALPEILPPGLDQYLVERCARLSCIGIPLNDVYIAIRPPL
jgi:ferredoxin